MYTLIIYVEKWGYSYPGNGIDKILCQPCGYKGSSQQPFSFLFPVSPACYCHENGQVRNVNFSLFTDEIIDFNTGP